MRKTISILLLIAILFNVSGYYITFLLIQESYKHDFHANLKSDPANTDILSLAIEDAEMLSKNSEFKWTEDDEFCYKGKMFDVISYEKKGTLTIFKCLNDKKEEVLLSKFEEFVKSHSDSELPCKQKTTQLLRQIITEAALVNYFERMIFSCSNLFKPHYHYSIITFVSLPEEKPPKA